MVDSPIGLYRVDHKAEAGTSALEQICNSRLTFFLKRDRSSCMELRDNQQQKKAPQVSRAGWLAEAV